MSLLFFSAAAVNVAAIEVDLTRFGPELYSPDIVTPNVHRDAFFGVSGKASLIVLVDDDIEASDEESNATIQINDENVFSLSNSELVNSRAEIPIVLKENNSIRVELTGVEGPSIEVKVKQHASIDLSITGRVHFNLSVANFQTTREFYRKLGFVDALGPFPSTNTIEVSRGVGMNQLYDMYAEVIFHGKIGPEPMDLLVPTGRFVDMIEWKIPRNEAPAYAHLYHLGINRIVMTTTDLDADMASLKTLGTEFLSQPATRQDGSRFVIAKDPDGTFVELYEPNGSEPKRINGSYVSDIRNLTINVSDFERSRAFYRMLGFTSGSDLPVTEDVSVARAMGLNKPYTVQAELMRHQADDSKIELVEWQDPRDLTPPHPHPANHYGMQRINYATTDLEGDVAKLKAEGIQFLSPIAPCCSGDTSTMAFVLFFDPDGNFFQLLGAIEPSAKQ